MEKSKKLNFEKILSKYSLKSVISIRKLKRGFTIGTLKSKVENGLAPCLKSFKTKIDRNRVKVLHRWNLWRIKSGAVQPKFT